MARAPRKKADSTKPAAKTRTLPRVYKNLGLNAPDALLAARVPTVKAVDDCVQDWLASWLDGRAPGYKHSDPFPDYIDDRELDGRLDNLALRLEAIAPSFDRSRFINGKLLLKELGKKKSIGFFIARIYFYALRGCGLKAR